MALPRSATARMFYQAAKQRYLDAQFLAEESRNTAAVYLAGYGVECILKALILAAAPESEAEGILSTFHGARAHDYEWLKEQYTRRGGPRFPLSIVRDFAIVKTWGIELRYKPGAVKDRDMKFFLDASRRIIEWADERL